jgi:DNA polymerase III alpha subunit (gram-positive type)
METVILDFETSGLNQYHDDIIEIGAKQLNSDNKFSILLRPKSNEMISQEITTLTGISNKMLAKEGLRWQTAYTQFNDWLLNIIQESDSKQITIVSHNGESFDFIFLRRIFSELNSLDIKTPNMKNIILVDTLLLSKRLLPQRVSYRQGSLCQTYNIEAKGSHRAFNDVIALEQLYLTLADNLNKILNSRRNVLHNPHMIHDYIHFKK